MPSKSIDCGRLFAELDVLTSTFRFVLATFGIITVLLCLAAPILNYWIGRIDDRWAMGFAVITANFLGGSIAPRTDIRKVVR
jgi:hypothetical protein